jgi:hypothetical protein
MSSSSSESKHVEVQLSSNSNDEESETLADLQLDKQTPKAHSITRGENKAANLKETSVKKKDVQKKKPSMTNESDRKRSISFT